MLLQNAGIMNSWLQSPESFSFAFYRCFTQGKKEPPLSFTVLEKLHLHFFTFSQLHTPITAKNSFVAELFHVHEKFFSLLKFRDAQIIYNNLKSIQQPMFFARLCVFVCRRINPKLNHHPSMGSFCWCKQQFEWSKVKSYQISHSLCRGKQQQRSVICAMYLWSLRWNLPFPLS